MDIGGPPLAAFVLNIEWRLLDAPERTFAVALNANSLRIRAIGTGFDLSDISTKQPINQTASTVPGLTYLTYR
jgi:hypothetical protein